MNDIASYLEAHGGRPSAGSNWVMTCPFCDRRGHLYCTIEDSEDWDGKPKPAGVWICFGCGEKSRDFAVLLAELESVSFQEARATIGRWKLGNVKLRPPSTFVPKKALDPLDPNWLPPEYEPVGGAGQIWPKYLTKRNISRETAMAFKLGVCRRHDRCAQCKRISCPRNMKDRIILPIDCPAGRSFQARAILDETQPRYLSGDNSGQLLFGWHSIADSDFAVIVEGPFDALKVVQAGLPCVALMGKDIRESQILMLKMRRRRYVVALDPLTKDKLAIDSACKAATLLGGLVCVGLTTDPGDANEADIVSAMDGAVEPLEARELALDDRLGALMTRKSRR